MKLTRPIELDRIERSRAIMSHKERACELHDILRGEVNGEVDTPHRPNKNNNGIRRGDPARLAR